MDVVVLKKNNKIIVKKDNKNIKTKNNCFIFGNIYNLDELMSFKKEIADEDKIIKLFAVYKEKLFTKLKGEFSLIITFNNNIYLCRDKTGSHHLYYANIKGEYIVSNNLFYFMDRYKEDLKIDKQSLANYLCFNYIQAPKTIFQDVYKLYQGTYVKIIDRIIVKKYYDLQKNYLKQKNKIKNEKDAIKIIDDDLINSIKTRTNNKKNIGIFFSAGVDSTLITALLKQLPNKKINTYTIGFNDEEKNEADRAKKIAEYLNTKHHEYYITGDDAKNVLYDLPSIYSEPISDGSIIPTVILNKMSNNKLDVILTGDGSDQFFSCFYKDLIINFRHTLKKLRLVIQRKSTFRIQFRNPYCEKYYEVYNLTKVKPKKYYHIHGKSFNKHIRCMLYDVSSYLAARLFMKVSKPAEYYQNNLAHPFVDDDVVNDCLKLKYNLKYQNGKNKYILRKILNKYIPEELLNQKKNGFGIPLKNWVYEFYKDDIIKYSEENAIKEQNLFNLEYLNNLITKLNNSKLNTKEAYVLFSYLIFQIWYQRNIKDLWKN